jgi:hypothetical protein
MTVKETGNLLIEERIREPGRISELFAADARDSVTNEGG